MKNVYKMNVKGTSIINDLFFHFLKFPEKLPSKFQPTPANTRSLNRNITDYIAGMTDTFAEEEHKLIVSSSLT